MIEIIFTEDWDSPLPREIDALLDDHAVRNGTPFDPRPLQLKAIDEEGRFLGGLTGLTQFDWLFVKLLALHPDARGKRVGSSLLQRAEEIGRQRGTSGVYLDTFTFQAPGFYEKHDYREVGRLPMIGRNPQRIWFCKVFDTV